MFLQDVMIDTRIGGFTMIELLVMVTIVSVLATVAIPTYISYTDNAKRVSTEAKPFHDANFCDRHFVATSDKRSGWKI